MTGPTMPYTNLIDASLQGWTPGKVRGKCSPAVYRIFAAMRFFASLRTAQLPISPPSSR